MHQILPLVAADKRNAVHLRSTGNTLSRVTILSIIINRNIQQQSIAQKIDRDALTGWRVEKMGQKISSGALTLHITLASKI